MRSSAVHRSGPTRTDEAHTASHESSSSLPSKRASNWTPAAVAVARAVELGARRFRLPSAGNAGGAAAAYCALHGVPVHVAKDLLPAQVKALRIADNQTVIDQSDRHRATAVRSHFMLPDLFGKACPRGGQRAITHTLRAVSGCVAGPDDLTDRGEIAAALVDHGVADVDVIEIHVRRGRKACVHHPVGQANLVAPKIGFDPVTQRQHFLWRKVARK